MPNYGRYMKPDLKKSSLIPACVKFLRNLCLSKLIFKVSNGTNNGTYVLKLMVMLEMLLHLCRLIDQVQRLTRYRIET